MEKRKPIYRKLTEIILDEAFVLTVCPLPDTYVMRAAVQGFEANLEVMMDLRETRV